MKNKHKDDKSQRLTNDADGTSGNERKQNSNEDRNQRVEGRQSSGTERDNASDALSQGYFPDGPGGNYKGA